MLYPFISQQVNKLGHLLSDKFNHLLVVLIEIGERLQHHSGVTCQPDGLLNLLVRLYRIELLMPIISNNIGRHRLCKKRLRWQVVSGPKHVHHVANH
jgi:hypothetical protein